MPRQSAAARRQIEFIHTANALLLHVQRTGYQHESGRPYGINDASDTLLALQSLERSLHRIAERQCSEYLSDAASTRLDRRAESLVKRAQTIADRWGFGVYHQTDPRGSALYLMPYSYRIYRDTWQIWAANWIVASEYENAQKWQPTTYGSLLLHCPLSAARWVDSYYTNGIAI